MTMPSTVQGGNLDGGYWGATVIHAFWYAPRLTEDGKHADGERNSNRTGANSGLCVAG